MVFGKRAPYNVFARRNETMDFMELAKNRYSERFFDPRPVEQAAPRKADYVYTL